MTDDRTPRFRVRRLPDARGRLRRRQYEVACIESGADDPSWVRRTEHPQSLLRAEGVHPADIYDYLAEADRAWSTGVDPRRSAVPSEQAGRTSADYGVPRLRVRRLPARAGGRRRYEVELTESGADRPSWTRETSDPVPTLDPFLGVGDAHAVVATADRAWRGGVGPWESLYPGDRVPRDEVPGTTRGDASPPVGQGPTGRFRPVRCLVLALLVAALGVGLAVALDDRGSLPIAGPLVVLALLPLLLLLLLNRRRARRD